MINALKDLIQKNSGSISIAQFMQFALYDYQYGYYMHKSPIGNNGDFITAPEISQLFTETIAVWVILEWEKLGKPKKFTLVELGPGNGTLISDIIRITKKYFSCDICLFEISPILRTLQQDKLKKSNSNVRWYRNINELPSQPTIFIANEFFDALPIQQYVYTEQWNERKIIISNNHQLNFILKPSDNFSYSDNNSTQGSIIEVNNMAHNIYYELKAHIKHNGGNALIIDYGYINKPYISTLQAVKEHKYHNVLSNIGEIDITSHVDFSMFTDCTISTQRAFLHSYGIKERSAQLLKKSTYKEADNIMLSLHRLTSPCLMGDLFKTAILQ